VPSFFLIHPTVWSQYTNVTDRIDRQTGQYRTVHDRQGSDSIGEPFYKRSPRNQTMLAQATGKMSGPHKYDVGTNLLSYCCTWALPPLCPPLCHNPSAAHGCTRLADNTGRKKLPSGHHGTSLSAYIFATKAHIDNRKNVLNSIIFSTCPHNMANFGPLAAEISSLVWDTQANFNGFRVLVSLLQRRR